MRTEGLKDEHELQSWFVRRIERLLAASGRRLVGWDEILEGGLAPGATVMSWRGEDGGIAAARAGHDVVMSPNTHCYFDYAESTAAGEPESLGGHTPLDKVYSYEPVAPSLSPEQGAHVLGSQGNVWGELIRTPAEFEYKAFPRACALAEVCWSPRGSRDYSSFITRLHPHLLRLEELGVNYRRLD
jgi:hexosaminidase